MIEISDVSFRYRTEEEDEFRSVVDEPASTNGQLCHVSLRIPQGQVVVLCGESGCGKTTLTRLLNGLIPHYYEGTLEGEVLIKGEVVGEKPLYDMTPIVGSVFQNPRSQFFCVDVRGEVAFACENLGVPEEETRTRVAYALSDFSIEDLKGRDIFALSGGEKQKVACASVSTVDPDMFVLDEPSANLDIASIRELTRIVGVWKAQGKTVVVAEHRLSYLMPHADRVVYLRDGVVLGDWSAQEFLAFDNSFLASRGLRAAHATRFDVSVGTYQSPRGIALHIRGMRFFYKDASVLDISELTIPQGALVAVVGPNGAGKTTFARCLCGLEKSAEGTFVVNGRTFGVKQRLESCYVVMQNPAHQLFTEAVGEEVLLSMSEEGRSENELEADVDKILAGLNLYEVRERHPMSLSGGQQQRVAIAGAIASKREIIIYDEPTSGLDRRHMLEVAENLRALAHMGKTQFVITHDPELIDICCDWLVFVENGRVKWSGGWTEENRVRMDEFFSLE